MTAHHCPFAVLALVLTCAGCADGGAVDSVTVRDSLGIRIVENSAPDRPASRSAVHLVDLQPPDSALTAVPWTIDVSRDGRHVLVGDMTGARIAVFASDGRHLRDLGRPGEGPWELGGVSAIDVDPAGDLRVLDVGRNLIHHWSADLEPMAPEPAPSSYWGPGFSVADGVLTMVTSETRDGEMVQRLTRVGQDGETALHKVVTRLELMELPCGSQPAAPILAPELIWTGGAERTLYTVGDAYRVDLSVGDPVVTSIRRAVSPIDVDRAMAVEAVESGPGPYRQFMRMCQVDAEAIVNAVGHMDRVSPIRSLVLEPDGGCWSVGWMDRAAASARERWIASTAKVATWAHLTSGPSLWRCCRTRFWWPCVCPTPAHPWLHSTHFGPLTTRSPPHERRDPRRFRCPGLRPRHP